MEAFKMMETLEHQDSLRLFEHLAIQDNQGHYELPKGQSEGCESHKAGHTLS